MPDHQTSPCPFCGGNAIPMHTEDCYFTINQKFKDAPKGDLSLVPDLLAAWNRRAAPAVDAQADGQVDAASVKPWQERCDWQSDQPATKLMVDAMKSEIADLRAQLAQKGKP